ncbi:gag-protease polyprotein [Cucumis melo var. makuwa]|uniref:Gag-protease polyprotein n=1 Tax=Cucumis melo var. makuwa TaxID=1194695 RepID=A0A5D3BEN2_CUCMM|nr:gag-protease polyprotein [Cucumis melo var. makuwa]
MILSGYKPSIAFFFFFIVRNQPPAFSLTPTASFVSVQHQTSPYLFLGCHRQLHNSVGHPFATAARTPFSFLLFRRPPSSLSSSVHRFQGPTARCHDTSSIHRRCQDRKSWFHPLPELRSFFVRATRLPPLACAPSCRPSQAANQLPLSCSHSSQFVVWKSNSWILRRTCLEFDFPLAWVGSLDLSTVSYRITTCCASFGITRLMCISNGNTRLICISDGITRLICVSFEITRLIDVCVLRYHKTVLCRVPINKKLMAIALSRPVIKVMYEADRRGARRIREGHMEMFRLMLPLNVFIVPFEDFCLEFWIECLVLANDPLPLVRTMLSRRDAYRGSHRGRGRGAGRVQPEVQSVAQSINLATPVTHADLVAMEKYNPKLFDGSLEDLVKAQMLLSSVETIFRGTAWWEMTKRKLGGDVNRITWEQFNENFYAKFFSVIVKYAKRQEFLNLEQGDMTVEQYDVEFDMLSRFDPDVIRDEAVGTEKFVRGLRLDI